LNIITHTTCRCCGSENMTPLFSLGEHFVSDFVDREHIYDGTECPIDLEQCRDCTLVQMKHTAPQELLYSGHYWYVSGRTQTMRDALRDVAAAAERVANLKAGDVVLDIGSNDGTFLRSYEVSGLIKVGVEPAKNLAEEGAKGVGYFFQEFWPLSERTLENMRLGGVDLSGERKAKVITALGMLYDAEDPNAFVAGVARCLAKDGVFIAQLMCAKNMLAVADVGNLCHEHLLFFSLRSLESLFAKHGLEIFDIETNAVNGESYRLYVRHKDSWIGASPEASNRWIDAFNAEASIGLNGPDAMMFFYRRACENRQAVVDCVRSAVADGKTVAVLGASTKGNTLLQWWSFDSSVISFAAERSPEKHGKFTIGTGIPIVSEEEFRRRQPDFALILPYAFEAEIREREREWHERGGRFILPLPEVRIT